MKFFLVLVAMVFFFVPEANADTSVTTKGGVTVQSDDGFKLQIGGRVMADATLFGDDKTALTNGTELRRARLYLKGKIPADWAYKFEMEFAGDQAKTKDAWLGYNGLDSVKLRVGNFKEPFSLEEQNSAFNIPFMELSLVNAFVPGRHMGLGASMHGENWTGAMGVFGKSVSSKEENDDAGGISGRLTYSLFSIVDISMHLGTSASYRVPDGGEVQLDPDPEIHLLNDHSPLVNTGTIENVRSQTVLGLEAAAVFGAFSWQGEYMVANLNRENGNPDVGFDGYYTFVSWFPTGESRSYNPKKGKFGSAKPLHDFDLKTGGSGAWEIAARYSEIDLNDGPISGGKEQNTTLGVNWYINPNVRMMANYVRTNTDEAAGDDDPSAFMARFQMNF